MGRDPQSSISKTQFYPALFPLPFLSSATATVVSPGGFYVGYKSLVSQPKSVECAGVWVQAAVFYKPSC